MKTNTRKKKTLTTAIAVALAVLLMIGGGTLAYLQDASDYAINELDPNKVTVKLTETSGQKYSIIPGTSETKNPVVTVDNTVDAYVFLEVTDNTQELIGYEINEELWTKLDGYDNVYYMEVDKDDETKDFTVLVDNEVTYSAGLENSDMLDTEGNLKTGVTLAFKASAIQKEGFSSAADAYKNVPVNVSSAQELEDAVKNGVSTVIFDEDIDIAAASIEVTGNLTLDLNGYDLTASTTRMIYVKTGGNLVIKGDGNSTITSTERRVAAAATASEAPLYITGGAVVLDGVKIIGGTNAKNDAAIVVSGTAENATLEIKSGVIDARNAPYAIRVARMSSTRYGAVTGIDWEQSEIIGKIAGDGAFVGIDEEHKNLLATDTPVSEVINGTTYYFVSEKSKECTWHLLGL